ncbi:MAG: 3-oxoacyl-ACP synthase [Maribacter sp.]|nr:3-oxoacyl-ACP synthase [Maribacter sp.]
MKDNPYKISAYCRIKEQRVSVNGEIILENSGIDFPAFIKSVYKYFDTDYPKFFKMDNLSKLAFMAAEILIKRGKIGLEKNQNIALVFSNRASSLDTDRKHEDSIKDLDRYYPSPAIFVYTLPNICMGEISIRHHLYSENSFFIFDEFNPGYLNDYTHGLLEDGKADKVLCGWVELEEDAYDAFLYMVTKNGPIEHNAEAINRLYKRSWEI